MPKSVKLLLGLVVSAAMMYLAFKEVKVADLKDAFLQASWWPVIPFVALWFLHFVLRALRWRVLLPTVEGQRPSLRQLFDSIMLGNLATFLLPFRLGEFIRPLILTRWTNYTFATAFASVVIERFFDLAAVLITMALIVPFLPALPDWALVGAYSLGVLAAGLLVFIIGACLIPTVMTRLVTVMVSPLPKKLADFGLKFSGDLITAASVVGTPGRLMSAIGLTAGVWFLGYLQFYAALLMFPHAGGLLLAFTLGVMVALAVALPSAPGFVGVFQAGCVAACNLLDYPLPAAQALSLIVHVLSYALFILIGFWLLAKHDLSLGELKTAVQQGKKADVPVV